MRYGLVPVARRVQAHRDLLVEYDARSDTGGAFLYENSDELLRAVNRLAKAHADADGWSSMVRANALVESGWSRPLSHLNEIYRKALVK
jgi:glycogen synthase